MPLPSIYKREEDFSVDLADNLDALRIGSFEDPKTESKVGTRRADIVADGEDGIIVIENQFGKANWDHWGRLEAYARLKEANVAVLVAEDFEELMIVTCNLRNQDSAIDWYLVQAQANAHKELSFHHVARPAIDIQTERKAEAGESEFWAPIRNGEFGELFAGRPVPVNGEGAIGKQVRGIRLNLKLRNKRCYIQLQFPGADKQGRRDEVMTLFPKPDYDYEYTESKKFASVIFVPVIDKGKKDPEYWHEVRKELVARGTSIYNKINESDL